MQSSSKSLNYRKGTNQRRKLKLSYYRTETNTRSQRKGKELDAQTCFSWFAVCILLACIAITTAVLVRFITSSSLGSGPFSSSCINPPTRREWRSLWPKEKKDYIHAVQCLYNTPSRYFGAGSLLDDFAYVHKPSISKFHVPC